MTGEFADGPDIMLWNPHLRRARRRWEALRAALPAQGVLCGVLAVGLLVTGIEWETGVAAVLAIGISLAALASVVFAALVNLACFATDHVHQRGRRCRVERHPGEFFFRTQDFTDFGDVVTEAVSSMIAAINQLHVTPARAWLDPALPCEAHLIAWETLCWLDGTRTALALARQLGSESPGPELADAMQDAIAGISQTVHEVAGHLRACVTLTDAWTAKLHRADLEPRIESALDALPGDRSAPLVTAAEGLPQSVFAYVTAARDVTSTGPFPWEQNRPAPAETRRRWLRPATWNALRRNRANPRSDETSP